jgi:hypothetical protein
LRDWFGGSSEPASAFGGLCLCKELVRAGHCKDDAIGSSEGWTAIAAEGCRTTERFARS